MTTVRICPTCQGPIRHRPGPGRWPAYCRRACRPEAVRDRAAIASGEALPGTCRGCGGITRADRQWCSTYCAVTAWQARYRSDRALRSSIQED